MLAGLRIRLLPALIGLGVVTIGLRGADVVSRLVVGSAVEPVRAAKAEPPKADAAAPAPSATPSQPMSPQAAAPIDRHAPDTNFSAAEVDLLQNLAKRREEIDQRDAMVQQREATLKVTEDRVNQKLVELSGLKVDIEKLLDLQKKKQDEQVMSLVKIYSDMKAPDAARIFNTLETPVLLSVVSHMKEQKSAAIIAAMEPERARELTMRLADLRQLPDGAAAAPGSAGAPTALTPAASAAAIPVSAPAASPVSQSQPAAPAPRAAASPKPAGQSPAQPSG